MMADRDKTMRLLKTARGQIEGIMKMVEEDRYCIDISTQLMATQSLIGRINADVLKAHIGGCVQQALAQERRPSDAKLAEIEPSWRSWRNRGIVVARRPDTGTVRP
ncbi:MAG: metal-sensing transcriptional repressor [Collinsella intestinalis]